MIRIGLAEVIDDRLFRAPVDFGDKIMATLFIDLDQVEIVGGFDDHFTCGTSGTKGNVAHRLHSNDPSRSVARALYQRTSILLHFAAR